MMRLSINWTKSDIRRSAEAYTRDDHVSYVTLADGQVVAVPHANLAAAKELLAMQKAALRRAAAARAQVQKTVRAIEWERVDELEMVS